MKKLWMLSLCCYSCLAAHDLVDVKKINPKLCPETQQIYLERYVITRLGRVQRELAKEGIGLVVLEGYRSPSFQQSLEENFQDASNECDHYCKGIGMDLMIYYLDGSPIQLPSPYGESTPQAQRDCFDLTANEYHNSYLLEKHMMANGFVPQNEKWWHFDLKGWESAPHIQAEYDELQ